MTHPRVLRTAMTGVAVLGLAASALVTATGSALGAPGDPTVVLGGQVWQKITGTGTNPRSGAHMLRSNVDTNAAGQVVISTMRHCGSVGAEGRPAHPAPCGPGEGTTWYSSGRIHLPDAVVPDNDFTMTVTASLPTNAVPGTRSALWITNGQYCASGARSYLGELDLVEMYGSAPATAQTNTHITCQDKKFVSAGTKSSLFRPGQFNTWTGTRRGDAISYRLNGGGVADYSCGIGAFSPTKLADNGFPNTGFACRKSLGASAYTAILQGEVFAADQKDAFAPPSASATFPTQRIVVADARVVTLPKSDSKADLFALNKDDGGATAVHRVQASTRFQAFSTQVRSAMHATTGSVWRNAMGDYNGDGVTDLYSVNTSDNGRTSVHVWDGATNFQTALAHTVTPLPSTTDGNWALDVADFNGDGRDDLFAMYKNDGGTTAVHVVDAASGLRVYSEQIRSALHATTDPTWVLQAGDFDGDGRADLYAMNRNDGGRTAVHVVDAASRFQSFSQHAVSSLPASGDPLWRLDVGDRDGDGRGDLYATYANDGGRTAVHVLPASTGFQGYAEQVSTGFGDTSSPLWDVLVAAP